MNQRQKLVESAPILDALFDSLITAVLDGVTPALGAEIRRIARTEARPLSEYRAALRAMIRELRAENALDERIEDNLLDAIFEAIAAGAAATEIRELHDERELRDRVVSSLAHDLRTPLSAMRVASELLASTRQEPARTQQIAARIRKNVDRADHMIRDLLDANAIRGGGTLPCERSLCNLVKIAQDTIDDLTTVHGNRFVLRASSVAIEGMWDASAVRRIIENLCVNAVKYGRPQTTITVTLISDEHGAQIDVHNEGEPIDDDAKERLFVAFRRADAARNQTGWGVGLALVRGLAEAHGGQAQVTSNAEAGTTFRVLLPR
jgi:signal transduction histidine kinase